MYDFDTLKKLNKQAAKKAEKARVDLFTIDVEEVREHFGDALARHVEQQRLQLIGG